MSIEQERPKEPPTSAEVDPKGIELYDQVYPKPDGQQPEPVIRPDVDEDTLGYN